MANLIRNPLREFKHALPTGIEALTAFAKRQLEGDRPEMPDFSNGTPGSRPQFPELLQIGG